MVSVTKIDPSEIPEVKNKFLMRSEIPREGKESDSRNGNNERRFGWSKRSVPQSRSGRIIKGRGSFRYRTPSRSRSRSFTPEHWKKETRKLIKFTDFEKIEEQKKSRDEEIKRRMEERKKRHEALSKGDAKKPFYELSQDLTVATAKTESISEKQIINDPNALDYEIDEEELRQKKNEPLLKIGNRRSEERARKRSRSRDYDRRNDRRDSRTKSARRDFDSNKVYGRNRFERRSRERDYRRDRDRRSRSRSRRR